jgi:hypothetical protein
MNPSRLFCPQAISSFIAAVYPHIRRTPKFVKASP